MKERLHALAVRRAEVVFDIEQQRAALREASTGLRRQFAWTSLAFIAGQALRRGRWVRLLTLGAFAVAAFRRMRANADE